MARRPRFPAALPRPRLVAAAEWPCVVLTAPAGGGKTVLAAQLADATAGRTAVAWVRPTLPGSPASTLVDQARMALGAEPFGPAGPARLAEALLDAAGGAPLLLVLEDTDNTDSADLARWLAETVPLLDTDSSVVVCARERPAGLLGRLGTAVRVLDAAELAFTVAETGELLDRAGTDRGAAATLHAATGGWPAAVAVAAARGGPLDRARAGQALAETLHAAVADDPPARLALDLLALAPAVPAGVLATLTGTPAPLKRLVGWHPLIQSEDGLLRLAEPAREAWRAASRAGPSTIATLGDALANSDPATAVELLLDAGHPERAAEVLAGAVGRLPVSWVRPRLYRLPGSLRRALPPALSAVQATVDLDSAIGAAERAVALASTPAAQAAARFALGSALAHRGDLETAAVELAAASRGAGDARAAAIADAWLGLVRFWLGDVSGAEAAVSVAAKRGSPLACAVLGECALERGDLAAARRAADDTLAHADADLGHALGNALLARVAVHAAGRPVPGSAEAARAEHAYREAAGTGGLELLAAAGVHGWFLLAAGRTGEAAAVAESLHGRLGRQDAASRLQAALLRLAAARTAGNTSAAGQAAAEVSAVRRLGFATLEAEARRFAPGLAGTGRQLRVRLLGEVTIEVDGAPLTARAWRSRKAREALLVLAAAGPRGLRRDELVEGLWPGREPGRGRTLLRTALAELRRVVEPGRPAGEPVGVPARRPGAGAPFRAGGPGRGTRARGCRPGCGGTRRAARRTRRRGAGPGHAGAGPDGGRRAARYGRAASCARPVDRHPAARGSLRGGARRAAVAGGDR